MKGAWHGEGVWDLRNEEEDPGDMSQEMEKKVTGHSQQMGERGDKHYQDCFKNPKVFS